MIQTLHNLFWSVIKDLYCLCRIVQVISQVFEDFLGVNYSKGAMFNKFMQ